MREMEMQTKTRYAIKMSNGFWVGANLHWTLDPKYARSFEFMTTALRFAEMEMGLGLEQYSVEAV